MSFLLKIIKIEKNKQKKTEIAIIYLGLYISKRKKTDVLAKIETKKTVKELKEILKRPNSDRGKMSLLTEIALTISHYTAKGVFSK